MNDLQRLKRRKARYERDLQEILDKDYYTVSDLERLTTLSKSGIKYRLYRGEERAKRYGAERIDGRWVVSKDNFNNYWKNKCPGKFQEKD